MVALGILVLACLFEKGCIDLALMSAIGRHSIQALWAQLMCNGITYKVALSKQKTITQIYSATIAVRCHFVE